MNRRRALLLCTPLLAALAACSSPAGVAGASATVTRGTTPPSSAPVPSSASPSSSVPAPTGTETQHAPAPPVRTVAALKKATLVVADLPSGFSQEPSSGNGSGGPTISSRDSRCADLVVLMNARSAPGSRANAEASFSGGQSGPSIDESLDALGTADQVAALLARLKTALGRCTTVTMAIPGQGHSTMHVALVNPPKVGTAPVAARVTGQGGPLDGFELTQVYTGVGDVVLSMTFVGATPDDVDGATGLAHDKAASVLGIDAKSSTS